MSPTKPTGIGLALFFDNFRYNCGAEQVFDNRQQVLLAVGHKSIIADFNKSFRQYVLQKPVDKFKNRNCD
jgi:tRNA U34 2-thiouridine synthase MnmA/TrmU